MNNYVTKIKNTHTKISNCIVGEDISVGTNLRDIFVAYYFENRLKIIKLGDMVATVVLYDGPVTLIVNPITLAACVYYGHIKIVEIDEHTGQLTLKKSSDEHVFKMGETIINTGKSQLYIETVQCKIMTLRDIFMFDSDPLYIKIQNIKSIIPKSYMGSAQNINNDTVHDIYHPKTLVYVIGYISHSGKHKHTILIGKGANAKTPTGYNFKDSKFSMYIKVYADKLDEKHSYIFPMFWFSAKMLFSNAKLITL